MPDENIGPINDPTVATAPGEIAEVVVYEHVGFGGAELRTNQGWSFPENSFWNDRISSIVVVRGRWRFFRDDHGKGPYVDLGPGRYGNEQEIGFGNDQISSFTYFA